MGKLLESVEELNEGGERQGWAAALGSCKADQERARTLGGADHADDITSSG